MMIKPIYLYKILYESSSKKYKIIFHNQKNLKKFYFYCPANHAKNIAMASECVDSPDLSQYELFINLLSLLKIKISNILIRSSKKNIYCEIKLIIEDEIHVLDSSIHDAIIIGLKSLCAINIDTELLENDNLSKNTFFNDDNMSIQNKKIYISEMDKLRKILVECINDEKYNSAALIRDRINKLSFEE